MIKHLRARKQSCGLAMTMLLLLWQIGHPLQAATFYWDTNGTTTGAGGASPSGAWDGTNNFFNTDATGAAGGTLTALTTTGDTVIFAAGTDATGAYNVIVTGTQNIGGLTFEEGSVNLAGGTINLGTSPATIQVGSGLTALISSVLSGSGGLNITGGGRVYLTAANTFTGNVTVDASTLALNFAYSSDVANPLGAAGARTFTLTNGGILQILGNTYNPAGTTIKSFVIGSGGGVFSINAGAQLQFDDASQFSGAGNLTVNSGGNGVFLVGGGGGTYTGFTGNVTINGGTVRVTNVSGLGNTGSRSITVNNGGALDVAIGSFNPGTGTTITLNGDGLNNTGALLLSQATTSSTANNIVLASNSSIGVTGANNLTLSGAISGDNMSLTKVGAGAGTLILSGLNTYTGSTIVSAGVLVADSATNAAPINSASGLVFSGSGTFRYTGLAATARSMTLNGLTLAGGAGILDVNNTGTSTTLTLGTLTRATGGGSVDFRATTGTVGTTSLANFASVSNVNGILGGFATVNSGANLAALDGSKNVVAYTAYTNINTNGSVIASDATSNVRINTVSGSGNITLGAATTDINTLFQNTATAVIVDTSTGILRLGSQGGIIASPTASTTGSVTIGTAANSGTLTSGGAADTAGDIIVNTSAATPVTINSVIADNGAGVVSLTKTGQGAASTLTVNGTNTYTGVTAILAGTFSVNAGAFANINTASAIGRGSAAGSAADLVLNGGTLQYITNTAAQSTDRLFSVGLGNGTIDASGGTNGTLSFTGTGAIGFNGQSGSRTLTLTGTNTGNNLLASVLGDSGGATHLTKSAAGTWVLTGNNTYTGTTTVSGGILQVGNGGTSGSIGTGYANITGGTIAFNRSDSITVNNHFFGGTTGLISQNASSTLSLGNATSSIGGLRFNNVDGGIIDLVGGDLFLASGTAVLASTNGTINSSAGGRILLGVGSSDFGAANGKTLTINAVIADGVASSIDFFGVTSGTGVVVLMADNTFSGTTNIQSGVVSVSKIGNGGVAGNLGTNGTINIGSTTGTGITLRYTGTGETNNRVINLAGTTAGPIIEQAGSGLLKFTANFTATGAGAKVLTLQGSTTGTGEIAGTIVNSTGTTSIAKNGTGTWTLSGANTYTGTTVVNGGALILGNLQAVQNSVISSTVANTTTAGLVFKSGLGGTFSIGGLGGSQALALVDDTSAALTSLTIGGSTLTTGGTYSGVLSGSTPITKTGSSTQTFTGVNTYTGKITITGGILAINSELALGPNPGSPTADQLTLNGGAIGAIANTTVTLDDANRGITIGTSGGSFDAAAAGTLIIARSLAGASNTVTKSGSGVVVFTAANTYGATNITGGRLILSGAGTLGSGTVTLSGGAALAGFTAAQALTIGATSGTLLYTQTTGAGNDVSSGLTLTAGGTLTVDVINSAATVTYATAFGNSLAAGVSKVGAGTLTLAPATSGNTFTGTTTVGAGTLALAFNGTSVPVTNIIAPTSALSMRGGTLSLLGVSGATNSQTFASTALLEGGSTLSATQNSATSLGASLGAISRDGSTNRGTINFVLPTTGAYATTNTNNSSGILGGWATVGGTTWATVSGGNIASYTGDTTDLPTTAGSTTVNYRVNAGTTLGGAVSANAIRFTTTGLTLALGSNNLTLTGGGTGGILLGLAAGTISGTGTVGAGAGNELLIYTNSGSTLTISAVLAGGAVTKSGAGTLTLSTSTNTFNGALTINGGTVSIDNAARVSSASGITLNGGTLTVSSNQTTDRPLTVGLNGGTFNFTGGNGNGGWSGALSLISGGSRTITFNANNAGRFALFSGVFADAGGPTSVVVNASGDDRLLQFSGANSTNTGATTLNRGVLRINAANGLSPGSNITFNGGTNRAILEFNTAGGTSFTRELGTQPGQVQWLGNGGFSSNNVATFVVNLGGNATPATVVWNSGSFVPTGNALQFAQSSGNSNYGSGTVDFRNPIDLNGTTASLLREVNVADNGGLLEAILSGAITNSGANPATLSKSGTGALRLNGDSSASSNVALSIASAGGYLILNNASAIPGSSGANVTINAGGALVLAGSTNPLASIGSRIVNTSAGSIALDVNSSANMDFTGFASLALGAYNTTVGVPIIYTGTITPAGTAYRIAPGGRNANLAAALTGNTVVNLAQDNATNILVLPNANTFVDSGGARSLALGSGATYLTSYNAYTGGTTVVGSNGNAVVAVGNDAALGSGLVTFNAGSTNGFVGALNGDRALNNNVSVTTTGNWVASADLASDGVTNAGSLTYNGTVNFASAQTVFGRTRTPIFLGNITAGGMITIQNTAAIYATAPFGGTAKSHSQATTLADGATLLFDSNAALGTGTGTLTMGSNTGSSTLRLAPGSGSVILTGRTIAMRSGDHNPIINVWGGDTLTMPGNVTGNAPAGGRTFLKNGAGTLVLSGTANTYASSSSQVITIRVDGGVLELNGTNRTGAFRVLPGNGTTVSPLILGNSANGTFSNGGTLRIVGSSASGSTLTQDFGSLTLAAKDNALVLAPQAGGGSIVLNLASIVFSATTQANVLALTMPAGSSVPVSAGGTGTANSILLDGGSNAYFVMGTSAGSITDFAARDAATTNFNIITGTTAGIYTNNTASALSGNANISGTNTTLAANTTLTSLRFNEAAARTVDTSTFTLSTGGILVGSGTGSNNQIIQGTGALMGTGGTTKQLIIYQASSANTLTISAPIADNAGASFLVKSGPGTLVLSGSNTFTNSIYLNGGVLSIATAGLGASPNALGQMTAGTTNVIFNGGSLQYTGVGSATTDRGFQFNANGNVEVTQSGGALVVNQVLTGISGVPGIMTKTGAGTLSLSGTSANSNLGVSVAAGTLNLDKSGVNAVAAGNGFTALIVGDAATARITGGGGDQIADGSGVVVIGTGTLDLNGNSETIDALAGTGVITNTGSNGAPITLTLGTTTNNTSNIAAYTLAANLAEAAGGTGVRATGLSSFGGTISDNGSNVVALSKGGAGTQTLSYTGGTSTYTYSGNTTITSGALILRAANLLPFGSGKGSVTLVGNTMINGITVPGILDMGGFNQSINGLTGSAGSIVTNTPLSSVSANQTNTLTVGNNDVSSTFDGIFQDGYVVRPGTTPVGYFGFLALTKTGAGVLTLTGTNTNTGATTINGGRIDLNNAIGNALSTSITVNTNGTLRLLANNQINDANSVTVAGGAFDINGRTETVGVVLADGSITDTPGGGVLSSNSAFDLRKGVVSAVLGGSSGLAKTTSDTVTLSGINTYSGATTTAGSGALVISSTGAINNSSGITLGGTSKMFVNGSTALAVPLSVGNGATLGGQGTVNGTVTVAAGGIIEAGQSSSGTLSVGTLNFSGAATLNLFNLDGTASILNVLTGMTTTSGLGNEVTINITNSGSLADSTGNGYKLIDVGSGFIFGPANSNFKLGTVTGVGGRTARNLNYVDGDALYLTIVAANPIWSGATSSEWSTGPISGSKNWLVGGNPDDYIDLPNPDTVVFDDTATGTTTVNISVADVSPNGVTFNFGSVISNYTLEGTKSIIGGTSLAKDGTGTLTINNANAFTGGVVITNGTIKLGNATALGTANALNFGAGSAARLQLFGNNATFSGLNATAATPVVENGDTTTNSILTVNLASGTNTYAGILQDGPAATLGLTKQGGGTLILTGVNTLTGGNIVSSGTLQIGSGGSTGSIMGETSLSSGASLVFNRSGSYVNSGGVSGAGALSVLGGGTLALNGNAAHTGGTTIATLTTLQIGNGGSTGALSGAGTITNNGVLAFNRTGSSIVQGNISGTGALSVGNGTTIGTLILTGSNIYSGSTTINANATLQVGNGGTSGTIGTGTITNDGTLAFNRSDSVTVSAAIGGAGSLRVMSGLITLTGSNTFNGGVQTDAGGTLTIGNGTTGSILGLNGAAGGNVTNNGTLTFNRTGTNTWDNLISGAGDLNVAAGTITFTGTGNSIGGITTPSGGATLAFSNATGSNALNILAGSGTVAQTGAGTLNINGTATGSGATIISGGGTVTLGANNSLNNGAVTLGNNTTSVGNLNLATFNQTITSLTVNSNSATANTITIGSGRTLTVTGGPAASVTFGNNSGVGTTTNVTFGGGGSFEVIRSGGTFQVGGATGTTNTNNFTVDMSGLANFTANLGSTGVFKIGSTNGTSATTTSIFTGAANNTITAGTFGVGDNTGEIANAKTFNLGSGTNIINANTINLGETSTNRGVGVLQFSGSGGTLTIRSASGATGTANLTMINSASQTTGQIGTSQLLLNGYSVDVSLNNIVMAARSAGTTAGADALISFDTGTFSANSVSMVSRTGTTFTSGASSGTINIGGTTALTTASLGAVTMTTNSVTTAVSTGAATATLNITGIGTTTLTSLSMANNSVGAATSTSASNATVNIGVGGSGGTPAVALGAVTMANNTAAATSATNATAAINIAAGAVTASSIAMANTANAANVATATLAITGGSLTLGGNISTTNGLGTENTTLTLAGGTLNMGGFNIGAATAGSGATSIGTLNFQSGTLQNVGTINGTAGLTKTTAGTLVLGGTTAYTGDTTITQGTLRMGAANVIPGGTGFGNMVFNPSTATTATLDLNGFSQSINGLSSSGAGTSLIDNLSGLGVYTLSFGGNDQTSGFGGSIQNTTGSITLIKNGLGTQTLSGITLSYTGATVVNAGILNITGSAGSALATSGLTVAGGATLNLINSAAQAVNLGSGIINLGAGAGSAIIGLELSTTSAYDRFVSSAAAVTANNVVLNLTALSPLGAGNYDLLTAASGLNSATYSVGTFTGVGLTGRTFSLTTDPTYIRLSVADSSGTFYWDGSLNTSWSAFSGLSTNWTTDLTGDSNANGTPGAAASVIFSSDDITGTSLTTTLDAAFSIKDLTFNNQLGAGPLGIINIQPGTAGSLTITDGINVQTGAPAAINLSAPIILGAHQTWTVADALTVLSSSGGISGSGINLTKAGDGRLALLGTNTYSGITTVNGGILAGGVASAFSASSAHVIGASGTLALNGFAQTIGSLEGVAGAIVTNGAATGNVALTTGGNNTSTTFAGSLVNGSTATLGLTKVGTGTLMLSGTNTYTGTTVIQGGVLRITGSTNTGAANLTVGNGAAQRSRLLVETGGALTVNQINTASNATAAGAVYVTGGTLSTTQADGTNQSLVLGGAASAYGSFNVSGGTASVNRITVSGNGFANVTGVFTQTGGTFNANGWTVVGHTGGGQNSLMDLSGGTYVSTPAGTQGFALNHGSTGYAVVNVRGSAILNRQTGTSSVTTISLMQGNTNSLNNVGIVNLMSGGTIRTAAGGIINGAGTGSSNNLALLNLNGGTIITNVASSTLINVTANAAHTAASGAYVYSGGVTIDSNGLNSTIPAALLAPSGEGVASIAVANEGSGYLSAPMIKITGGSGAGATAVANMVDDGLGNGTFKIGSITVTNPGTGYVNTDVLTLAFADNTSLYTSQATFGAVTFNGGNTSGGLTKIGAGTLTLSSAASTFAGPVLINAGILQSSGTGSLANIGTASALGTGVATSNATNAASLVLNGGTYSILSTNAPVITDRLFTITQNGGTLSVDNTTGANVITFGNTAAIAYTGSGTRTFTLGGAHPGGANANTFAILIGNAGSDAVTLQKTGTTNWQLTNASNSYTGGTNILAGILGFVSGALGTTGNVSYTGTSTLQWAAGNTSDISSRLVLTSGVTGTVDTGANNVVFANAVGTTGGTTGVLRKTGSGALTLNAAAAHTGGTELNAGSLNIGHFDALGTGTFTISGTSTFDNTTGSAGTLTGNPAQAWNGDFTFTGTNSLNMGTGAVTLGAARAVTVSASTLTVGGNIGGLFGLTKNGPGTLYLSSSSSTFGAAAGSNITINGGVLRVDSEAALGNVLNDLVFANGATLQVTTGFNANAGKTFSFTAAGGGTIQVDSGTMTINSALIGTAGSGGLIKTGAGTLALTAASTGYDPSGVGAGGATNVGFRVDAGTLLLASNSNSVVGDNNPTTMTMQMNGGNLTIQSDTANIARANLWVSAPGTLTIDNLSAGPGITQAIGAGTAPQLTMGTGASTLNITGGSNVTSGTAVAQFNNATFNVSPTFNLTNPTGATMQLTLGAVTAGANTATFTGNGNFTQTGVWSGTGGITLGNTYSGLATLSQANTYTGVTTVNGGTLAFSTSGNLGDAASATNTITLGGGTLRYTAAGALNLTTNRVVALTTGTTSTVEVSNSTGNLQVTGGFTTSGAANLVKTGDGNLTPSGALNLNGGNLNVSSGTYTGGLSASGIGGLTIGGTGSLQLVDSTATAVTLAGALTLNGGSRLGFELGASGTNDSIASTLAAITTSGVITLDFYNLGSFGAGTYNLLTSSNGGLLGSGVSYVLGTTTGITGYNLEINQTDTLISLTTSILSNIYWTNSQTTGSWNTLVTNGAPPPDFLSNFSTDLAGTSNSGAKPATVDTVIFSATSVTTSPVDTTLDAAFTIDSLVFNANPAGGTFSIAPGTGGSLTLAPVSTTNGISVGNNGGAVTISAPLTAGLAGGAASQTWFVDGTGTSSLAVTGNVTLNDLVTKTGAGVLTLSGTNSGAGGFTLTGGTAVLNSSSAVGTGIFTINSGTTLDSTLPGLTLTAGSHVWNGSFIFTGGQSLNLGAGNVALGGNLTLTANANTLTVGGNLSDGLNSYDFTKAGAGTLTVNGTANNIDGTLLMSAGTLNINNGGTTVGILNVTGGTASLNSNLTVAGAATFSGGTVTANGTNSISGNLGVSGATVTMNGGNTISGTVLASSGTLTLGGANTITGGVILGGATLNINNAGALGGQSFTINSGTINNTSGSAVTNTGNTPMDWNGSFTFTGTNALNLGTGAVTLGNSLTATVSGSGATGVLTVGGVIDDGANTFSLTKAGTGTLTLTGLSSTAANNYSGTTLLNGGTLNLNTNAAFTGGLTFGPASTDTAISTLNINNGATFGGTVTVQTSSATANTINIAAGQTLTTTGAANIGNAGSAGTGSRLTVTGATGTWVVNASGQTFRVGGSSSVGGTNILNLSGLGAFNVDLGSAGAFRFGSSETANNPTDTNTVQLAITSTIKAGTLDVGGNTVHNSTNTLSLGTGVNVINANNIDIGSREATSTARRASGVLNFQHVSNGSVTIRAYDGTSAAAINLVNSVAQTNTDLSASLLLAGHDANVLASTLIMASRAPTSVTTTTSSTATLTFDQGTFTTTGATTLSSRGGSTVTTGDTNATATFGGGTVSFGGAVTMGNNSASTAASAGVSMATLTFNGNGTNTITGNLAMGTSTLSGASAINDATEGAVVKTVLNVAGTASLTINGALNMAVNSGTAALTNATTAMSTVNISGGSVSVTGNISMGNTTANALNVVTNTINLTGGALTVGGNIAYTNGVGTENVVINLQGGLLDMTDGSIGASGALITFNTESGTLQNVAQINNGAGLAKTTAGTLILEGTNTYTGGTTISGGVLQVGGGTIGVGSITGTLGGGNITNNATLAFNRSNSYTVSNNISGTGALNQIGSGTTVLSGTNTHTGKTTISAGKLSIDSEERLGANPGSSTADQLTLAGGTLLTTATFAIDDANRGITVSSASAIETATGTTATINSTILGSANLTKEGAGTLIFTAVQSGYTGTLTVNDGTLAGSSSSGVGGGLVVGSSGTLAPGSTSAGLFSIEGNLTSSGTLLLQLGGATANDGDAVRSYFNTYGNLTGLSVLSAYEAQNSLNDFISVSGASAPTINGTLKIGSFLSGYTPVYGDIFDLMDWAAVGGVSGGTSFDFGSVTLSSGLGWNTDLFASNGIIVVIPEPSRALFLMLGLLGLMLRRRRR